MSEEMVRTAFPELDAIDDDDLRVRVVDAWTTAIAENEIDDLTAIPWLPPTQRELGLNNEFLVDHVRDVTACAVALAETLSERRALALSLDTVIAGALVHDVSKLAEFNGMDETAVYGLLGHPYYGVHVVARADLPIELAHIVLSHTSRTAVEPATIEAELVRRADEVAAAAIRSRATDDLRTV
ncbi:HD domain-containing protein [Natrialba asiatica]|uniref:Metal dependent phosphohydrolase n=1 Tax=Natrialba asiatica (strain ATCC 700177 / DSM 12278 / JCM 9576 / FERM P-10747 / NBRC 102637 / 172P1) TaxID=29540 RepID=M0B2Z0_NATA1|nr:HD domain-containing protein [Natrialba asiatica]ELZ04009.1 metal dependent phosphohydrolase [Natrialba asiatica DSM 12278]